MKAYSTSHVRSMLSVSVLLTVATLLFASWKLPIAHSDFAQARLVSLKAVELRGQILHYDEVLTMACRMASQSGDAKWGKRYLVYVPLLEKSIDEAIALFPEAKVANKTNEANQSLIALETQAFERVREGDLEGARRVFEGEYEELKETYAKGMSEFGEVLENRAKEDVERAATVYGKLSTLFMVLSVLLASLWAWVLIRTRALQEALLKRNLELDEQALELRQLNQKLEESQARLVQAEKMKSIGSFVSGVAHNFNNQLHPILVSVDEIEAEQVSPTQAEELGIIRKSASNCRELVDRLMSFSRPEESKRELLCPRILLSDLEDFLSHTLPSSLTLKIRAESGLPNVMANRAEIQSVFLNLAANAKAALQGTSGLLEIVASRSKEKDDIVFKVRDTGPGMPPEVLARVFEPFFTTRVAEGGTGLGLSTVFGLVKDYGGTIDVQSKVGEGTVFTIVLPGSSEVLPEPEALESQAQTEQTPVNVLFVDDEPVARRIGLKSLGRLGFQVTTAKDGQEALERYREGHFDAIVSDVTMPVMGGLELAKRVYEYDPKAQIILCSGDHIEVKDSLPVVAVFKKPFRPKELAQVLRQAKASPSSVQPKGDG